MHVLPRESHALGTGPQLRFHKMKDRDVLFRRGEKQKK